MNKKFEKKIGKLRKENKELREVVAVALNKPLLRELSEAIREIENGEYTTEEDFARKHNLVMSKRRHLVTA